jgi:3-phytase
MKNLLRLVVFFFSVIACADKVEVELKQTWNIPHKEKFKQTRIGGLSGLFYQDNKIYAVSDDRGRFGPARIYEFLLARKNNEFSLKAEDVILLNPQKKSKDYVLLDLEGLAFWQHQWILSSEGDLNKKPRISPEILSYNGERLGRNFVSIPSEFLPNASGMLNHGLKNNMAFEGLTIDAAKKKLYLLSEADLIQDKNSGENVSSYLLAYDLESKKFLQKRKIYFETGLQLFLYFGASEITYWKDNKFFILTRGVSFSSGGKFDCALWLLDLDESENEILKPKMIFDFKAAKLVQNYEGMTLFKDPAGVEFIVVVSDDNFDKAEFTEFLFLKVK